MDSSSVATMLGCGLGLFFLLIVCVVGLVVAAFICYQLYLDAQALPPANRKLAPGLVFLLLVPLVNLFWLFYVVLKLAEGYKEYFAAHPAGDVGDCGQGLGLGWAVATLCVIVPVANKFAGIASLVLMILYLVKMSQLRGMVASPPGA
jgi:hypothetical protein